MGKALPIQVVRNGSFQLGCNYCASQYHRMQEKRPDVYAQRSQFGLDNEAQTQPQR